MSDGIQLGDQVRDRVTGFEGMCDSITQYLSGSVRIGIQPTRLNDGKLIPCEWFDESRVEVTEQVTTLRKHRSVFVYGPAGCGKTRFAQFLAKYFQCTTIVDGDRNAETRRRRDAQRFYDRERGGTGVLFLSIEPPCELEAGMVLMPFSEAMKSCGLDESNDDNKVE